ncbi:hypothetical protein F8388_009593 [Cannabis sativa]|uniref:non-specific serine/threonine protein kinase n=1 Tax=Cannabis sativa TaxID=3483 RepID=A0A7J6E8B5_CANSA|nr:hypothetical protein F8388_009593 [Cannabis sativa]
MIGHSACVEMENSSENISSSNSKPINVPPLPRDSRGSLEVFNPSTFSATAAASASASTRPTNPPFRPQSSWHNWVDPHPISEPDPIPKPARGDEIITSWMALKDPAAPPSPNMQPSPAPPLAAATAAAPIIQRTFSAILNDKSESSGSNKEVGAVAAQRAAEWGLVLKTDSETGKPQGVGVRTSGGDEPASSNVLKGNSRRSSNNSVRTSGESSDDGGGGKERGFPRVSEDLKDALSAFQQTFVVSDATKPDYPILYASAGFFKMTGYTSKEVIGRNCRFLQGSGTDPEELAKIRESLEAGSSYCGRMLNYKKDGTPFWNLLTIAPIKDETGKILKFIGMQVEVSKHTEGSKEKTVRPNGLPESLIRYDARQKDMANSSVNELVQAVKRPRALSESMSRPFRRKSGGGVGIISKNEEKGDHHDQQGLSRRKSESSTSAAPPRRNSHGGSRITMQRISELPEKKHKKSNRRSFMGFLLLIASWSLLNTAEKKSWEEIAGPETDPATVKKIRDAIDNQKDVTVQLINYTKTGKKFWNLFHLQPMRDQKGEVQYFIGVQLDGSQHVEPLRNCIPEQTAEEGKKLIKETAENVDDAVRELPDANMKPEDLWLNHSKLVLPKPHRKDSPSWQAFQKILGKGEQIGLKHFKPIKPLGSGDTGSVHLVELCGTGQLFAMKAMDKSVMLNRNKVHRACAEREILDMLDHPFLPALYASFQTKTHICLITDYCPGGELFMLLDKQPTKVIKEEAVRFYAAEVITALEYLHCQGIIYRDLKPENVLIQGTGHVALTDFDLSCLTSCKPQLLIQETSDKKKSHKNQQKPIFMAEPMRASNSFVGTEEYIAPEIITGAGHTSILLYEMLYGYTPFRGKTRQKTFANILHKDLKFPGSIPVSLQAKQLMYRLLHRDPKNRLGSREGANEIKRHPFFRGVNWALVRCMNPPKLEAPLFETTENEKGSDKVLLDPHLEDLQNNVF